MTTEQILKLARKKLLETSSEIFSDEDLLLYANLSKDEIASRYLADNLIKSTVLDFTSGSATIPADFNSVYYINDTGQKDGIKYVFVDLKQYLQNDMSNMVTEENGVFKNNQNKTSLTMWYYSTLPDLALLPTIVNPSTSLKPLLHELIVYGIVYRAFEDAQDFELSKYFKDKFEAEYTIRTNNLSELEENPKQSGQMFDALPDLNFNGYSSDNPNYW